MKETVMSKTSASISATSPCSILVARQAQCSSSEKVVHSRWSYSAVSGTVWLLNKFRPLDARKEAQRVCSVQQSETRMSGRPRWDRRKPLTFPKKKNLPAADASVSDEHVQEKIIAHPLARLFFAASSSPGKYFSSSRSSEKKIER